MLEKFLVLANPLPKTPIYANKAYFGQTSKQRLEECQFKNCIQVKANLLSHWQKCRHISLWQNNGVIINIR